MPILRIGKVTDKQLTKIDDAAGSRQTLFGDIKEIESVVPTES